MGFKMIIKCLSGDILVETQHKGARQTLEWCAENDVDLSGADLRKAKLSHAALDGLRARNACFWGADLTGSDVGFSDLSGADLRCAALKDTCFAQSILCGADLQGAYFSATILEGASLDGAIVSCPSFWDCDLRSAHSIEGLVYNHLGEHVLPISSHPIVVRGFCRRLVLLGGNGLWGNDLHSAGDWPPDAQQALFAARTALEKTARGDILQSAKKPIRKIPYATGVS